jgi:hypothetical protein
MTNGFGFWSTFFFGVYSDIVLAANHLGTVWRVLVGQLAVMAIAPLDGRSAVLLAL